MPRLNLEIANSPWDQTQTCELLAPGVWWVTTAGHGGLMVDAATARETLSKAAIAHGMKWCRFVCYEEDCQYSIAFFERPDWYRTERKVHAHRELTQAELDSNLRTVKDWEWKYYEAKTGIVLQRGESYCKDQDTHRKSLPQLSTVSACILAALVLFSFVSADATSKHKSSIEMIYQPLPNGDFRLSLYGSDRALVCEEKDIKIIQQGDAVNPLVFECKH